jgi:hypothetical protein
MLSTLKAFTKTGALCCSIICSLSHLTDFAHARAQQTCTGEFQGNSNQKFYMVGSCSISAANAKKVMKSCSLGQQCEITGTTDHCRGVRGACLEMIHIASVQLGKALPLCAPTDAGVRADKWWSQNTGVVARGTVVKDASEGGKDNTGPYGHMKIIMDLSTCSNGSPMAVDRVPEGWAGHYVEISGNAMKGGNGWYIIVRSVKDVER